MLLKLEENSQKLKFTSTFLIFSSLIDMRFITLIIYILAVHSPKYILAILEYLADSFFQITKKFMKSDPRVNYFSDSFFQITKKFMKSDPRVKYLSNSFFRSKMDCEGCLFTSIRFRDLINHMGCAKHLEKVLNAIYYII